MKGIRGLFIACSITCLITFLFAFTMKESSLGLKDATYMAAITTNEELELNEGNVVDLLSKYVQTSHLAKVNVRNKHLYIDIKLHGQTAVEEQLLEEIPRLIQFSFFQVHNIDQLHIKTVSKSNESLEQSGYFTLHITKDDEWLQQGIEPLLQVNWLHDHHWQKQLRLKEEGIL